MARYLFDKAESALDDSDPYSDGLAISLSQDATESLLRAVAKKARATVSRNAGIFEVWKSIEKAEGKKLPFLASVEELNIARIGFKHHGNLPDSQTAVRLVAYAHQFLVEVARDFLQLEWHNVSLADAIGNEEVREHVKEAEIALQEMDIDLCLQKCALANHVIEQLIRLHLPKLPRGMGFATGTPLDQIVDALGNMVNTLSGHLGSTTLGLRPSDVSRFRSLIPQPLVSPMNKSSVQFVDHSKNRPSLEDAKFCVRYATDMALRFEQQWQ